MLLITLRSSLAGSRKVQPRYLPGDMALLPPSETRCQRASQALSRLVEARERGPAMAEEVPPTTAVPRLSSDCPGALGCEADWHLSRTVLSCVRFQSRRSRS